MRMQLFCHVEASAAACSVLFVGSVQPMYSVAAACVSFKLEFIFVFPDSSFAVSQQVQFSMNFVFCPLLETFCPLFIHLPSWIQVAETAVHFAHFHVQARKRGVLGWVWPC